FGNVVTNTKTTNLIHYPIPIFLNPDKQKPELAYGFISDETITLFHLQADMKRSSQIVSVSQDGVQYDIQYAALMDGTYVDDWPLYQIKEDAVFPYVDIQNAPGLRVVSQL